jgi:myo-inositol-1(or 4)-monophosphatase
MKQQIDWIPILVQCKNSVQRQIAPLMRTLKQQQPDLGIGAGGDPIRQVDLAAEKAIVNTLESFRISFTLISEESGIEEHRDRSHEYYVTTDPIDGTTNLIRGIPFSATSIAISTKQTLNTVSAALVADLNHEVVYTAQKGKGAFLNGKRIASSKLTTLEEAVIGLDLNTYRIQKIARQVTSLIENTKHIRHLGANALELCYVADGKTDAFVDLRGKLRTTDIAAAWLMLREAGAGMVLPSGKTLDAKLSPTQHVSFVAAGNPQIQEIILDLIRTEKEAK